MPAVYPEPKEPEGAVGCLFITMGVAGQDWHWGAAICAVGASPEDAQNAENELRWPAAYLQEWIRTGDVYFICNDKPEPARGRQRL